MNPHESPNRVTLRSLAESVTKGDATAIEEAVAFLEQHTRGLGHNRARAKLARRLKHVGLTAAQRTRLVEAITARFIAGGFDQQFVDQVRLLRFLDPGRAEEVALSRLAAPEAYVRRLARRVLAHQPERPLPP